MLTQQRTAANNRVLFEVVEETDLAPNAAAVLLEHFVSELPTEGKEMLQKITKDH